MGQVLFIVLWFLFPALPASLYVQTAGSGLDAYTVSVALGVFAFTLVMGQFLLASRPAWATRALGTKGLLSLHATVPVVIVASAIAHETLKEAAGFSDETAQATLGGIALVTFAAVTVLTVLLMANTFWMKLPVVKKLKEWTYAKTGLTYKLVRALHNVTVLAGAIIIVHMLLASSSSFAANPAGAGILVAWAALSLGSYAVYRVRGRKAKGN